MREKLFGHNNPNHDILVVPREQGGTEDDTYFGSIGDATLKHIQSLSSGEEMLWRELITVGSGALFRFVPSFNAHDNDPFNLRGEEDLEEARERLIQKFPETVIDEAIEVEMARRDENGDVMDVAELIPFDEWERFPQMWQHIDIPSTPRDVPLYMGNTRQAFYDVFPEGHPDAGMINQCLAMLNRDWEKEAINYLVAADEETSLLNIEEQMDNYAKFVGEWVIKQKSREYTREALLSLIYAVRNSDENPDELVTQALVSIDTGWAAEFKEHAARKSLGNYTKAEKENILYQDGKVGESKMQAALEHASMLHLMLRKEEEWKASAKEGYAVYNSIKAFGQLLFQNYRSQMTGYLWARYRRNKTKYCPAVIMRGIDINRCGLGGLERAFRIGKDEASKIWVDRPFESIDEIYNKGYISGKSFADDEKTEKIIDFIDKHAKISEEKLNLPHFDQVRGILIREQKKKDRAGLSSDQWSRTWRYYTIRKENIKAHIYAKKEAEREQNG